MGLVMKTRQALTFSRLLLYTLSLLLGLGQNVAAQCACDDLPPTGTNVPCAEQAAMGKCGRDWMQGYCRCSCGTCREDPGPELRTSAAGDKIVGCQCPNTPPPFSPLDCVEQAVQGKCARAWMQGYCECTCGTCAISNSSGGAPFLAALEKQRPGDQSDQPPTPTPAASSTPDTAPPTDTGMAQPATDTPTDTAMPQPDAATPQPDTGAPQQQPTDANADNASTASAPQPADSGLLEESSRPAGGTLPPDAGATPDGGVTFQILHFNDFHVRFLPTSTSYGKCEEWTDKEGNCQGGFARLYQVIMREREAARREGFETLLLDAGDDSIGTSWAQEYKGKDIVHFMNKLDVDAMTPGNHDFDYGDEVFKNMIEGLRSPVLTCNIDSSARSDIGKLMQRYVIKEIGGKKIGILGVTTEVTAEWSNPWPLKFSSHHWGVKNCAQELKDQGVDIIIALTHVGYSADLYLGRQVEHLDLVIGGHSHAFLYTGNPPAVTNSPYMKDEPWGQYPSWVDSWVQGGRRIPVVQANWATRYVGKIKVTFDKNGELTNFDGYPILLGGQGSENPESEDAAIKAEIKQWKYWHYD